MKASDHVPQCDGNSSHVPDGFFPRLTWYTTQIMAAIAQMRLKMVMTNPAISSPRRLSSQLGSHMSEW